MKPFEKDKKALLEKILDILEIYSDMVLEDNLSAFDKNKRELNKITAAVKKWKDEL
jgi:hypothetical protein